MKAISGLSIVIPAYNEEKNMEEAVTAVLRDLPGMISDFELILVDDGSTDSTGEIMDSLSSENNHVLVVHHGRNRGKGAALITGFSRATREWILFLDADSQITPSELAAFLPYIEAYSMIIGYRALRSDSWLRRSFSKGFGKLIAITLGVRVKDLNCPFKLFRKAIIKEFDLASQGFLIDAELIYKTSLRGYRIKELPVKSLSRKQGCSSVRPRHVLETLRELFRLLR